MCFVAYSHDTFNGNYFADRKRNRKRKPRAKPDDETVTVDDKETEGKQEVESGAEEQAAEAVVMEDEGTEFSISTIRIRGMNVTQRAM